MARVVVIVVCVVAVAGIQALLVASGHPSAVWTWCDMAGLC